MVQPVTPFSLDVETSTDNAMLRTFSVPPIPNFSMTADTASQVSALSSRSFDPWAGRLSLVPRASEQLHGMARTRSESISSRRNSCIAGRSRRTSMISMAPEERLRALGGEAERLGRTPRPTRPSLGPPLRSAVSRPRAETWATGASPGTVSDRVMSEAISEVARMPRSKSQRLATVSSPREDGSARSVSMLRSKSLRPAAQSERRSPQTPFSARAAPTPQSARVVMAAAAAAPAQRPTTARHLSRQPCGRRPAVPGTAPSSASERRPAGRSWRTDAASSGRWRI